MVTADTQRSQSARFPAQLFPPPLVDNLLDRANKMITRSVLIDETKKWIHAPNRRPANQLPLNIIYSLFTSRKPRSPLRAGFSWSEHYKLLLNKCTTHLINFLQFYPPEIITWGMILGFSSSSMSFTSYMNFTPIAEFSSITVISHSHFISSILSCRTTDFWPTFSMKSDSTLSVHIRI